MTIITQDIQELMDQAVSYHRSGRLPEAESLYRQVLQRQPRHPNALHLLGLVAFQAGRAEVALEWINHAIALNPNSPDYHLNRGVVLDQLGRTAEAIDAYNHSIALKSDLPETHANLGNALRKAGRLDESLIACRRALDLRPEYVEAHMNLGNTLQEAVRIDEAVNEFHEVLRLRPDFAEGHFNLGNALARRGDFTASAAAHQKALQLKPQFSQAARALGGVLEKQGQFDEAIAAYRTALATKSDFTLALIGLARCLFAQGDRDEAAAVLRQAATFPDAADAHCALGSMLLAGGDPIGAATSFRQAIALRPDSAEAHAGLANIFVAQRDYESAAAEFRAAVVRRPDFAEAYHGLGLCLSNLGNAEQAIASFNRAVSLNPLLAQSHAGLGVALSTLGEMDSGIAALRQAAALAPDDSAIQNSLGVALKKIGELDQAIACYERAVELAPNNVVADSNAVYATYFHPAHDAQAILQRHLLWNQRHVQPLASAIQPHENDRSSDRKLRIGYVSPDFREHVVGFDLLPLLSDHDRSQFEIFCYSAVSHPDELTDRLRSHTDTWREIFAASDEAAAEMIRADKIDILVDLSLHLADNRLLIFARKPAPVQLTYLGYAGTTGVQTIDYRLSDPHLDPPDSDVSCYSEQTVRLPTSYWCYRPGGEAPDVSPLPSATKNVVTFGCMNNFAKVSANAIDLWCKILGAVPDSRLVLQCPLGSHRLRVLDQFEQLGITPDRVELVAMQPWLDYMSVYGRIDIAIDPIPYGGGITTCDGLFMGVPCITLSGETAVGRGGRTILNNIGLPELVADTPEDYVRLAVELAGDQNRLAELRAGLRQRMLESPLMDATRFAREVEAAYRQCWSNWTQSNG